MTRITAEEARWLRQLLGTTQKRAPEVVQRRLLSLGLAVQKVEGLAITDQGRLALRSAPSNA